MKTKTESRPKVPVSTRALIARINRRLARADEKLYKSRGVRTRMDLGEYYILDVSRNFIRYQHVGLEELGKELGVLKPYQCLATDLSESQVEQLAPAQARRLRLKK